MSTHLLYLSQIRTVIPAAPFEKIEHLNGEFNDVVVINGEWVFRFPRYREGAARITSEANLLRVLKDRLPLPIPDPIYTQADPPVPGLAFLGYPRLTGEPFYREALDQVRDVWAREDMAGQIASFLRSMHNMPLTEVPVCPQVEDKRSFWEKIYAEVREKLYTAMRPDARREVTAHFETYLDDSALQSFTPCLRHGDFGGANILWDKGKGTITGVVDFSHCAAGDPAVDLAGIWTSGNDFFDRFIPRYERSEEKRSALMARARFYRGTFALLEALDGLKYSDTVAYKRGMEEYI